MRKAAIVAFGLAGAVWGTDGLTADSPLRAIKRPSPEEIATASPDKGEIGKGLFRCVVTVEGVLQDCDVEGESPVGVGFGAAAINPYLALETVEDLSRHGLLGDVTPEKAVRNTIKALDLLCAVFICEVGVALDACAFFAYEKSDDLKLGAVGRTNLFARLGFGLNLTNFARENGDESRVIENVAAVAGA